MSDAFTPGRYRITSTLGRYRITSTPSWGRGNPGTSDNRDATIGDGDVFGDVCGWVRASCLTPASPAAPAGPTATVTLAEQVTETRHVEAQVEVRYYRDGEDVTDRVVAKADAPTSTSARTYPSRGGGEVHVAAICILLWRMVVGGAS